MAGIVLGMTMQWKIETPDPAYTTPMEYMEAHNLDWLHVLTTVGFKQEPYAGTLRVLDDRIWSPDFPALDKRNWTGWQILWPVT